MAAAEQQTSPQASHEQSWHGIVLQALKRNEIRLVPYVPDRVLSTLIKNLHADPRRPVVDERLLDQPLKVSLMP